MIDIVLDMDPPRATAQGKRINRKTGAVFHSPEYLAAAQEYALRLSREREKWCRQHPLPLPGGVSCCVTFTFPTRRGKDFGQPKTTRPDLDNMLKCVLDELTKAGYWYDDAQVCFLLAEKKWAKVGSVEIEISDYMPDGR